MVSVQIKLSELIKILLDIERRGKEMMTTEELISLIKSIEESAKGAIH